jgi:site-specific recombinase XerD
MVQKERGMNRLHSGLQLRRLPFLHARNQRLVAEYLRFLTARHSSPKTIQATVGMVKSFCVLLPVAHQSRGYRDFTRTTSDDIDAWLDAAHHHGLAPSTLNNILNALHRFFAFLQEQGYLTRLPINRRRHQVLVPQTLPKPMADTDLIRLFKVIDTLRDRTIFLLMLRCGLRVGEVSALTWPAIDFHARSIRIDNSKGQVDRVVYDSADVEQALVLWRRAPWAEVPYVFRSPLKPGPPLSVRTIQRVMARYLRQAGIAKPYSPHALRQTFATHLLNAGAPLEVVKELMGHRSIGMTLRYTQLYETTKRGQYDQAMEQIERQQAMFDR